MCSVKQIFVTYGAILNKNQKSKLNNLNSCSTVHELKLKLQFVKNNVTAEKIEHEKMN